MRNDFFWFYPPGLDVFDQTRQVPLDARLVHAKGKALVKGIANRNGVKRGSVNPDDRDIAAFTHGIDRPVKSSCGTGL